MIDSCGDEERERDIDIDIHIYIYLKSMVPICLNGVTVD